MRCAAYLTSSSGTRCDPVAPSHLESPSKWSPARTLHPVNDIDTRRSALPCNGPGIRAQRIVVAPYPATNALTSPGAGHAYGDSYYPRVGSGTARPGLFIRLALQPRAVNTSISRRILTVSFIPYVHGLDKCYLTWT